MGTRLSAEARSAKLLAFDAVYAAGGKTLVGMDEAGRGPLAGPVVAAAVVMPTSNIIPGINDSKKISEKKREALYDIIMQSAVSVGVGVINAETIDDINILNATRLAFKQAYEKISVPVDVVISDQISGLDIEGYIPLVKGDSQSYAIAAASIVAKVTRDRMMRAFDDQYPEYEFFRHKGYGTSAHVAAIKQYGPCAIHRMSFLTRII